MGVIWSVAPDSKIHEVRGSLLSREFFNKDVIVRILLQIKFLPELATEVELIVDEEFEIRSSNWFNLAFNISSSLFSPVD